MAAAAQTACGRHGWSWSWISVLLVKQSNVFVLYSAVLFSAPAGVLPCRSPYACVRQAAPQTLALAVPGQQWSQALGAVLGKGQWQVSSSPFIITSTAPPASMAHFSLPLISTQRVGLKCCLTLKTAGHGDSDYVSVLKVCVSFTEWLLLLCLIPSPTESVQHIANCFSIVFIAGKNT